MIINLEFFLFVINLFIKKFPFLGFDRGLPTMFIQTDVARQDFNVETLVTSHLKDNELFYTRNSFTSREFALFTYTNTWVSCFQSAIVNESTK